MSIRLRAISRKPAPLSKERRSSRVRTPEDRDRTGPLVWPMIKSVIIKPADCKSCLPGRAEARMLSPWRTGKPSRGTLQLRSGIIMPLDPDRRLRVPQRRRGLRAGRAERGGRLDVRAALRLAERLRPHPRPARRLLPGRPGRRHGAGRRPLPARHDDPGDQLGHPDRLDHRARRPADRSVAPPDRTARKTYRRTPNDYEAEHILLRTIRCVSGEVQTIDGLRAGARLRPQAHVRWDYTGESYHQGIASRRRHRRRS